MILKGTKLSEEHKRKIGNANRGRKFTKEQRKNMSIAHLDNKSHLGFKNTPEQIKNISEGHKGNKSHLGFKATKEQRKRMSESAKAAWARKSKDQREKDINRFVNAPLNKTSETVIELIVKNQLDKYGIRYFYQKSINKGHFIIDFYLPEYQLVVECNGDYWHSKPERKKRDRELEEYVLSKGKDILWLWEHEIKDEWFDLADYLEI